MSEHLLFFSSGSKCEKLGRMKKWESRYTTSCDVSKLLKTAVLPIIFYSYTLISGSFHHGPWKIFGRISVKKLLWEEFIFCGNLKHSTEKQQLVFFSWKYKNIYLKETFYFSFYCFFGEIFHCVYQVLVKYEWRAWSSYALWAATKGTGGV